jgi:hypothetical protein
MLTAPALHQCKFTMNWARSISVPFAHERNLAVVSTKSADILIYPLDSETLRTESGHI